MKRIAYNESVPINLKMSIFNHCYKGHKFCDFLFAALARRCGSSKDWSTPKNKGLLRENENGRVASPTSVHIYLKNNLLCATSHLHRVLYSSKTVNSRYLDFGYLE